MAWTADIQISRAGDEYHHVIARTTGDTNADALAGAQFVFNAIAKGREAHIRAMPEAYSETDFDTKQTTHRGFVRFSFKDAPGEHYQFNPMSIALGGAA